MAKMKLTKTVVDAAQPQSTDVELRDTLVPGFLCKVTPAGRKVFMIQYRTNAGERRKPSLGLFGELTVEQARALAQDWLAEVRRGGDPGGDKADARKAPTVKELCTRFMEDYSKTRNKPSTQRSYQNQIDRSIIPAFGSKKVPEITRMDVIALMKRKEKSPIQANRVLGCIRKMFNLAELWGYRPDGSNPCRHVPKYPEKGTTRLITKGDRTVRVNIPPGATNGTKVRLAGEGEPGQGGGAPGDLYLIVQVEPDMQFERHGDDLTTEVRVDMFTALLGGEVDVPTLGRPIRLKIPAGTQSGRKFRLGGKGMPLMREKDKNGDLYARILITVPEKLDEKQRELVETLRQTLES